MSHRLGHHRLSASFEDQGHHFRAVVDGPERRRLHGGSDVRTAWVLAKDADGTLHEVATWERLRALSAHQAAVEAVGLTGSLLHGGYVIARRGAVVPERSLSAWFSHHGDEWHGLVTPGSHEIVEIVAPDHVTTGMHLMARIREALAREGSPAAGTPERRQAVFDVLARLDSSSRQRAAQDLRPETPQSGNADLLVELVLLTLLPPEAAADGHHAAA